VGDVKHTLVHTARARGFTEGKSRPVCLYTYVYLMVCASDLPAFSHNIVVKQPFRGSVDYVESISTSPRPHGARLLH
jgi:hypothetical protein